MKPRQVEAELPKVNDTFQPLNLKVDTAQPARPREPVKTGLMASGSSAVPTHHQTDACRKGSNRRIRRSQRGCRAEQSEQKSQHWRNLEIPRCLPDLAMAMVPAAPRASAELSPAQDSEMAWRSRRRAGKKGGTVQSTGFANSNDVVALAPKKKMDDAPAVEPVVILAKPKPVYSAEAIKLNLEGEVLLEVVFPASGGEVQVNRVVKGLGHGLDEAAMKAAQQIKYKPALSNGHPVDFPAVVHIVFQIAY